MEAPVTPLKIGYARVSTDDQRLELQTDALVKAGVEPLRIYTDKASGATVDRPGFIACFKALRPGDTLVIWKLDRLGRNLSQLLQTAERLEAKQCRLLVVTEAIDPARRRAGRIAGPPLGRLRAGRAGHCRNRAAADGIDDHFGLSAGEVGASHKRSEIR